MWSIKDKLISRYLSSIVYNIGFSIRCASLYLLIYKAFSRLYLWCVLAQKHINKLLNLNYRVKFYFECRNKSAIFLYSRFCFQLLRSKYLLLKVLLLGKKWQYFIVLQYFTLIKSNRCLKSVGYFANLLCFVSSKKASIMLDSIFLSYLNAEKLSLYNLPLDSKHIASKFKCYHYVGSMPCHL